MVSKQAIRSLHSIYHTSVSKGKPVGLYIATIIHYSTCGCLISRASDAFRIMQVALPDLRPLPSILSDVARMRGGHAAAVVAPSEARTHAAPMPESDAEFMQQLQARSMRGWGHRSLVRTVSGLVCGEWDHRSLVRGEPCARACMTATAFYIRRAAATCVMSRMGANPPLLHACVHAMTPNMCVFVSFKGSSETLRGDLTHSIYSWRVLRRIGCGSVLRVRMHWWWQL